MFKAYRVVLFFVIGMLLSGYAVSSTVATRFLLTTNTSGNGTISPSSNSYASGTRVSVTATPAPGNRFTGWSGACSGT